MADEPPSGARPIIALSPHAVVRMEERGASGEEVREVILAGDRGAARHGRTVFRKRLEVSGTWLGRSFRGKVIEVFVAQESPGTWTVVTVIVHYSWATGEFET